MPTGANKRAPDGTAQRRERSAAGGRTGSRSTAEYRRSGGTVPRDPVEGRGCQDREPLEGKMAGTPLPESVSTTRQRRAKRAREAPQGAFLSLAHYLESECLRAAFRRTRKEAAAGVEGQSGAE